MPNRLYDMDSYTVRFNARIIERLTVEGRPALVLDATYFYPTGGGQPHDTGTINGAAVLDVFTRDDDLAVVHVLERDLDSDAADCAIDWPRRFDHMQQHTGQHILTQAFVQVAEANTVGFHLGVESVTIDLDRLDLTPDALAQAEALANQIVIENRAVTAQLLDPSAAGDVRKRGTPDKLTTDGLRVIEVTDFDRTACGGTHVAHTGEIGLIKILRTEKRGDKTRVEFRCGGRALADYRLKNHTVNQLTALLNVGLGEVAEAVTRQQQQVKDLQRALKAARVRLAEVDAQTLAADAQAHNGFRLVRLVTTDYDLDDARLLAKRITTQPGYVVLIGLPGDKASLLLARSADLPHDLNPALKAALALLGGRGGGKPDFVQGGGVAADVAQVTAALDAAAGALP